MRTAITGSLILAMVMVFASNARADVFACVNNSSGEVKIVASCTVGTNASPCHHNDTCDLIFASGTILQRLAADLQHDASLGGDQVATAEPPAYRGLLGDSRTLPHPLVVAHL